VDRKDGRLKKKKYEVTAHEVVEHIYLVSAESMEEAMELVKEEEVSCAHSEMVMKMIDDVKEIKYYV
jgi:hypothetical protein